MNLWMPVVAPLALAAIVDAPAVTAPAPLSDQTGVYGIVDEAILRPNSEEPQTLEVRGIFSVASGSFGNEYLPATAGYLAFSIVRKDKDKTLAQWRDIAGLAGSGAVVAFSTRYLQKGVRVRPLTKGELVAVAYPVGMGARKVENADYLPIRQLRYVPTPVTPAPGGELAVRGGQRPALRVLLGVHNCRAGDPELRYLFEVTLPTGETLASPPIEPTKGETTWDPVLALQPGDEVTWRVRTLGSGLRVVPVATATFRAVQREDK